MAHLDGLRDANGHKLLNGKDLDPHNKQHWPGCLKIFSQATSDALQKRIDAGERHLVATHAITVVFTAFLSSWLGDRDKDRTPLDAVEVSHLGGSLSASGQPSVAYANVCVCGPA